MRVAELPAAEVLANHSRDLDRFAAATGSIFLTTAWLDAWTRAFAPEARCVVATDDTGALHAAAVVRPLRPYGLASAADLETDDWTVAGDDPAARRAVWQHLTETARGRLHLVAVPDLPEHADLAREVLTGQGYRVAQRESVANPRLALPPSWDGLMATVSRSTRSLFRRRLRALNEIAPVRLRTSTAERLETDLACFYRLEASGWKYRSGTAIACRPSARRLYDRFARSLIANGWLRLQILELGETAVAADLSCTFADGVFMVKTAYDESWSRYSPGLVLRGEALRSAIDDGLRFYDFLGPADDYKLRWGATEHPHVTMSAFRGPAAPFAHRWHAQARPQLKVVRARANGALAGLRARAAGGSNSPTRG